MKTIIDFLDLAWFLFLATNFVCLAVCGVLLFIMACVVVVIGCFIGLVINSFAERTKAYNRFL